jgi:outer membrane protein assembly factor BamB
VVLLLIGCLGGLSLLLQPAQAQKVILPPEGKAATPKLTAAISLPIDSKAQRNMERVRALIEGEQWAEAVEDLQKLLDRKEDGYVKSADSRTDANDDIVSCHWEAARLLGTLPPEGMKFYEDLSGQHATAKLAEARKQESMQEKRRILREILKSYLHTKAGAKAVELLGTDCLERGEYQEAALRFKQLLSLRNADEPTAQLLLKAAYAFSRVDDKTVNRDELLKQLSDKAQRDGGIKLGDQLVSVDKFAEILKPGAVEEVVNQAEWPIPHGNPSRRAQGAGGPPFLEPSWVVSTLPNPAEPYQGKADHRAWVEDYLKQATAHMETRGLPVLPAFHPVAVNGKIIFRTYEGVFVVNLREKDPSPEARHMWQHTDGGAATILGEPNKKSTIDPWKATYLNNGPHGILFENSVTGTVTTDGIRAFVIDDLILPPNTMYQFRNFGMGVRPNYGHLNDQAYRNSLKVYDLDSFKLLWELGGRHDSRGNKQIDELLGVIDKDGKPTTSGQQGGYFLGPPLPLYGKLYFLHERGNELRLVCIEARDKPKEEKVPTQPELVWAQTLVTTRDGIEQDFNRRIHAAHLSYGEGILVCPTNAGAVLGVDLLTHALVWVHRYREGVKEEAKPNPNGFPPGFDMNGRPIPSTSLINEWKATPPVIYDGKVLFAAPDGNALHCLSLHRGKLLWKQNRADGDLYFAGVYAGKAVIVGKNSVRGYDVNNNGKEAWTTPGTGTPSGQGVASDNIYYLPVKASVKTKEPEIVAIDLVRGGIIGQTPAKTKRADGKLQEPGNLIFYEGQVISQTLTSLVSYPQVNARMAEIDERVKMNPRDPLALLERGELRLGKGELRAAIDDLHTARDIVEKESGKEDLKPRVRSKLYDSLTRYIDRQLETNDFQAVEKYLDEYKELCKSDNAEEQLARQSDFLSRLAKGREQQGNLLAAFDAYMEFGKLVGDKKLVRVSDQPNTDARPDVWARGRIGAMMARATPEKRKPLEDKIAEQWKTLQNSDDVEALENFVAVFGTAFEVGKEAKIRLAEKLMAESRADRMQAAHLRAQLLLLQLRGLRERPDDLPLAGKAVEMLARLMIQNNELAHAASYYKELNRDFTKTVIRDGKTGADLYNEIVVDKRFLPYLEPPKTAWKGNFKASEVQGAFTPNPTFTLEPTDEVLPFFHRHRLTLNANTGQLRVLDQISGDIRWESAALPINNYFVNFPGRAMRGMEVPQSNIRFTYTAQGHVVVLALGHMVYAFDPVEKRKLWEYNLFEPGTAQAPNIAGMVRDNDGRYTLLTTDGWRQRIGQVGPVEAGYVCLQTRKGLVALDPIKGPESVLWTKSDVSSMAHVFGDQEYIYVVEVNAEGKPTSATRAVRAADGFTLPVTDFVELYQKKLRIRGRTLLAQEESPNGQIGLRLYDVQAGKDLWTKTFAPKSVLLRSDDSDLTGVIDPEGAVTIFDIRAQKEVLHATVKKEEIAKLENAHILSDRDLFYLVLNQPAEAIPGIQGGLLSNVHPGMGVLSVNGPVYAFDRDGGKVRWVNTVTNQMLVLEQFRELPLLLFTVRYGKFENQRLYRQVQVIEAIDKHSGKFVWPPPGKKEMVHNTQQPFSAVRCDAKAGLVELEQFNFKMRFQLEGSETK